MSDDWKKAWQPMIEAIGTDFGDGKEQWGADSVEAGAIRKFLEPLEFDCPLHYDQSTAVKYGYPDLTAPASSLTTWVIPPLWKPGMRVFTSAERNAQPEYSPLTGFKTELAPPTTGFFATEIEIDYYKPVVVGDRLCRVGNVLLSLDPKETKVGLGAFMIWESEIRNQHGEIVAILRMGTYSYNPHS